MTVEALAQLLRGTWTFSGEASGTVRIDWLRPGHPFLVQEGTLTVMGNTHSSYEVIGHSKPFGATEADELITSRAYTDLGETLDYTWELDGDRLTIWGGPKGSPAYAEGRVSLDRNRIEGAWTWPGGGYTYAMTRATD